jgi:eukaryotic-like serine/threonine-protein kinase
LAGRLAGQPHSIRDAARLVEQLAETVGYLHRQGVVHGNLKPSNVLLGADGIPRLADFRLTGGLFFGSSPEEGDSGCSYLAPELADDRAREARPNTDIYGLGLILYELLTGRPPFSGATAREALEQVRTRDPEPPSRLNPQVPPRLDTVCLRCLRKNPWRRYSRVYDVALSLRPFLDNSAGRSVPHGRGNPLDQQQRIR